MSSSREMSRGRNTGSWWETNPRKTNTKVGEPLWKSGRVLRRCYKGSQGSIDFWKLANIVKWCRELQKSED
jgi:hypothetical protein